jgi:CRISPR/Cas system CMR-associated protein Cmr5 small subunit
LLFRAPILLLGAASPFVADLVTYLVSLVAEIVGVVDWLAAYQRTLHLSISLVGVIVALAAVAHVVVKTVLLADSAAFAVMAKRFGQDYEPSPSLKALETNRLWGFLQLAADTFVVGCVLATAASSITYSVIHHVSLANPFSVQPTILHTLFFYFDHAIRGLLFDFCEWFRISFQKTLEIEHRLDAPFAYFLFGYRKLMSALTIQIVLLAATYAFFASKDERATVTEELQEAKTAAAAARNRVWQLQAEIQEKEGLEKARRFLKPRELGRYIRITELKAVGQYVEKRDYRWWRGIRERLGLPEEVYG